MFIHVPVHLNNIVKHHLSVSAYHAACFLGQWGQTPVVGSGGKP